MATTATGDTFKASGKSELTPKQMLGWSAFFGLLTVLLHLPFIYRYDLAIGSGNAQVYLMMKRILQGELYIYQWGGDYTGMGPIDFFTALLFLIFKPSIMLACVGSLLFWGAGVSLLVWYTARYMGKMAMIGGGIAMAIGIPYFLHHNVQPYGTAYNLAPFYTGAFLLMMFWVLKRGPDSWAPVVVSLIVGWHWYASKHALVVWASMGLGLMVMPEGREFLQKFIRSKMLIFCGIAFLVGYSPEIIYRQGFIASKELRSTDSGSFLDFADPSMMAKNWYMVFRCIPMYFDADPWAREPLGVHYLNHMEDWESFPLKPADTFGLIAAFLVISFLLNQAWRSYKERNLAVFVLAIIPVVNVLMVLVAKRPLGAYYRIQQYLFNGGVLVCLWLGIRLAQDFKSKRWAQVGVLILTLCISGYHQLQLLDAPDELVDYKNTVKDIEASGYKYGLSWYPYSHLMTALADEKVMFGIIDRTMQSPYQEPATAAKEVAVVWPATEQPLPKFLQMILWRDIRQTQGKALSAPPEQIQLLNHRYQAIGQPKVIGELGWTPYRKMD